MQAAGLDGVECWRAQATFQFFFSPVLNQRQDEYGSFDNRIRCFAAGTLRARHPRGHRARVRAGRAEAPAPTGTHPSRRT